jgi:RHS repeat-associated protein
LQLLRIDDINQQRIEIGPRRHRPDYMHARYYRPLFGRFLSPDRGPGRPLLPQSWNRYAYVRDNPLALVDPNGSDDIGAIATGVPTGFKVDWEQAQAWLTLVAGGAEALAGVLSDNPGLEEKGADNAENAAAKLSSVASQFAAVEGREGILERVLTPESGIRMSNTLASGRAARKLTHPTLRN